MATGLPGYSCSKLFNIALSLTLTVHLVNPFLRLNNSRLRTIVLVFAAILAFLHLSDMVCGLVLDVKYHIQEMMTEPFVNLLTWFNIPGIVTTAAIYCGPPDGIPEDSRCYGYDYSRNSDATFVGTLFTFNFVMPPLLILVCMIIQVVYLRRSISEDVSPLTSASRHASITIIMVSLLFFISHVTFLMVAIIWAAFIGFVNQDPDKIPSLIHQGNAIGATEFTLPLLYAAFYPIILITRKPELRRRYYSFYRRIRACFRRENSAVPEN